jgi:predicted HAD superfamily phosphohydrolase YqeG
MTLPFNKSSSPLPPANIVILSDWNGTLIGDSIGQTHDVIIDTLQKAIKKGHSVYIVSNSNLTEISLIAPLIVGGDIPIRSKKQTPANESIHTVLAELPKNTVVIAFDDEALSEYDPQGGLPDGVQIIHVQVAQDKSLHSHHADQVKGLIGLDVNLMVAATAPAPSHP